MVPQGEKACGYYWGNQVPFTSVVFNISGSLLVNILMWIIINGSFKEATEFFIVWTLWWMLWWTWIQHHSSQHWDRKHKYQGILAVSMHGGYIGTWGFKSLSSSNVKERSVENAPVPPPAPAIWWRFAHSLGLPSASVPARQQNSDQSLWEEKQRDVFSLILIWLS